MKWWHLGGTELGMLFWVNLIIEKLHALLVNFGVGFNGEKPIVKVRSAVLLL